MLGKGYGMPSSHAQFITFFAVYLSLFFVFRHTQTYAGTYPYCNSLLRAVVTAGLTVAAVGVSASRIYLNYHTPKQVLAGSAAGVACAFGWFMITSVLRSSGWIDWATDLTLARLMRIRDLVVSEDLTEAGWQRWEARKKRRSDTQKSD